MLWQSSIDQMASRPEQDCETKVITIPEQLASRKVAPRSGEYIWRLPVYIIVIRINKIVLVTALIMNLGVQQFPAISCVS